MDYFYDLIYNKFSQRLKLQREREKKEEEHFVALKRVPLTDWIALIICRNNLWLSAALSAVQSKEIAGIESHEAVNSSAIHYNKLTLERYISPHNANEWNCCDAHSLRRAARLLLRRLWGTQSKRKCGTWEAHLQNINLVIIEQFIVNCSSAWLPAHAVCCSLFFFKMLSPQYHYCIIWIAIANFCANNIYIHSNRLTLDCWTARTHYCAKC